MSEPKKLHPALHRVKFERTFVMIKPDAVMRGLIGEIIHRFERTGLKVVAMKMLVPTQQQAKAHYPTSDEAWVTRIGEKGYMGISDVEGIDVMEAFGTTDKFKIGTMVVESLVGYLCSGPVVCLVIEGVQAIAMVRKLAGHTLPFKADVGTIRGDFSLDTSAIANVEMRSIHNLVHASENPSEAEHEIKLWFGEDQIHDYTLGNEYMMYSKYY